MKHPWVNILILVFVTVEFVSGFFGLVSGMRDEAVFIIIHRIAGTAWSSSWSGRSPSSCSPSATGNAAGWSAPDRSCCSAC